MKNLTKKQKIITAVVIVLLLAVSLLYNSDFLRNKETATGDDVARMQEEENKDLKSLTEYKAPEEEEEKGKITSFYISSEGESVAPGGTLAFTAYFEGEGDFDRTVHWSVQGAHHPDTGIGNDGVLKVSPQEKNKELFVRGVSAADPEKKGEKSVALAAPEPSKTEGAKKQEASKPAPTAKPRNRQELKAKAEQEHAKVTPEQRKKQEQEDKKVKEHAIASTNTGNRDQYFTEPTPEGQPAPVEPGGKIDKEHPKTATLSINCATILDNMDKFDMDKIDVLPVDGVIMPSSQVTFYPGESVYDLLQRETRNRGIHMEASFTPAFNSAYIEGINNLYEFDCGELSGWMYKVNGWFPNYGVSRYAVKEGDVIEFVYTCDLGRDVGDNSMTK